MTYEYVNKIEDDDEYEYFEVEVDISRISLCTLAAVNYGKIKSVEDFERPARLLVRFLDNLLSYQNYPINSAELSTKEFRPLGIGIVNFAYFLAKNGLTYGDDAIELVDEYTQAWSYYLIKASADLAEEVGPCELSHLTRYGQGILPIDTYKRDVDSLIPHVDRHDWEGLRAQLKRTGIRNATLMALMPAETSAQLSNSTNGIEPVRALVTEKASKHGILKQVVPEIGKLKNKYDLLWEQKSPLGYLKLMAVLQKYIDQAISVNTSYNPQHYPDGEISMKAMIGDLLMAYKLGTKNLYYFNTYDGQGLMDIAPVKAPDELNQLPDEECSSCVL